MIGAPVTTVRTPPLLQDWLAANGIDATVEALHLEPGDLASFMTAARADPGLDGLCVTMPHKRAIVPMLDGLEGAAVSSRSVNAVRRNADGHLIGAQFDGIALVEAIKAAGLAVTGNSVHLAGLGGAGLAIAEALLAERPRALLVTEPDDERRATAPNAPQLVIMPEAAESADADILVNATPLGMKPGDPSVFTARQIEKARLAADIVADPPATRLAVMAQEAGIPLVTGRAMVEAQIAPIGRWLLGESE